jgi:peptidoglycan/xylan/chitin deacetylase (PgdA/CDA1 family)
MKKKKDDLILLNNKSNMDIPILTYHEVTENKESKHPSISLHVRDFEKQICWLSRLGYKSLSMNRFVSCLERGEKPERKSVVISFDDGYAGVYQNAIPILKKYSFTGIFFIIEKALRGEKRATSFDYFTVSQAKDILKSGFELGSHSLSHADLSALSSQEQMTEIKESRKRLEEELSFPVEHFCYPLGRFNQETIECVKKAGYRSACSIRMGRNHLKEDLYSLSRIAFSGGISFLQFAYRLEIVARRGFPG